ncbi:MAG: tetratricopeptide repeat protein, partial [Verrucomicrobiales bacterium]|nr:tetratricopeptide repeat protein [Verrucomicrobiales bacterium]
MSDQTPKERERNDGEVSHSVVSPEEQVTEKTPTKAIKNEDATGNSLQRFETRVEAAINRRELDSESPGTQTAPAGSIPQLWQIPGFGFRLQGERGQNIETGSFVKDHVLMLFFVPVFALGSYRCVDSPDNKGWIILGREPLTRLCRLCNIALLLLIPVSISLFGWNQYRKSPAGLSSDAMAKAKQAAASNQYEQALSIYQKVIDEKWPGKDAAASELEAVFGQAFENSGSGQVISLMKFAAGSENQTLQNLSIEKAKQALHRLEDTDLAGAASILELLCENESLKQELLPRRVAIYQKIIDADPKNGAALRLLAEALYESKEYAGMLDLVEPFGNLFLPQDPISLQLGEACLKTGRHRDAIRYLSGYVGPKIMQLSKAEAGLAFHTKRIQTAVQQNLNRESGSQFNIGDETETDVESKQRYTSQVEKLMQRDPVYQKAVDRFREASEVVTHVFTLGMTQLHYALTLPPGDERQKQLKNAEKSFVILANKLGGNREYLLSLGQVQYRLGKSDEAKALFDRILELDDRAAESLLLVGKTMRDLGERNAA